MLDLLVHHHGDALGHCALFFRVTRRWRAPAQPAEGVIGQPGHDPPDHGHPVRAGGQDVTVAGLSGQVDVFPNLAANRLYTLQEGGKILTADILTPARPKAKA